MSTERGAAGGSAVLLVGIVVTAALNYGLGVALAWLLTPSAFGGVGMLLNLLLLATSVLAAGFPWSLARAVARRDHGPAEKEAADETFRAALAGNVGLGFVLAVVFGAIQLTTGAVLPGIGTVPTVLAAGTIVLLALGAVLLGALQGNRRFDAVGATRVLEIVVKVVVALGLVTLFGLGVSGVAIALFVSAAVSAAWAWWSLRGRRPGRGRIAGLRAFATAVPMAVATTGFGLMGTLDVLLLGTVGAGHGVTVATVGVYQAAAILARAPFFVGSALSDAVFPFIAGAPTLREAHAKLMTVLRWVPLALIPMQLVLLVTPASVLDLVLPAGYEDAAHLARVITIGTTGLIFADMLLKALFARGFAASVALRVPVSVAVQLAALLLLVPRLGAIGAAWAFAAGTWATVALLGVEYLRRFRPSVVRIGTVVRWLVPVAVLVGVLLLAERVPAPFDLLVAIGGLLVYGIGILRLGLLTDGEMAVLRSRLPGGRPAAPTAEATDPAPADLAPGAATVAAPGAERLAPDHAGRDHVVPSLVARTAAAGPVAEATAVGLEMPGAAGIVGEDVPPGGHHHSQGVSE
ncbi:hypothetical protein GCM10009836_40770 [Pseudonocardia ailaonensis]|uniref:Polysaccharide biosynthesis protein C-terminal domain-containing protein n=2 Tax=Pseudonocardia ailaonensis TaxID=367279 RepID=A0ABN2NAQ0_9PSEU